MLSICAVRQDEEPFYALNATVPHPDSTADEPVTAAGLARTMLALRLDELTPLERTGVRDDLAIGMPAGTRVAGKNYRSRRRRDSAALVIPPDAPPYALAVCYSGPLADGRAVGDPAIRLFARIAAQVWSLRRP
ncbi:hypothetical protein [Nocardia transvalensis]|uniref:hypothetical protein n=1 Tax=Nocardia transvalensis TaxID=37333 RepID=UPI001893066F|nr:hypothetical protein [Nocardia transvalensis]MBF6327756.1 hypothetical protein [Nocardia transvalensis]